MIVGVPYLRLDLYGRRPLGGRVDHAKRFTIIGIAPGCLRELRRTQVCVLSIAQRFDVEQFKQRRRRGANAELPFASDERQRSRVLQNKRPMVFAFAVSIDILAGVPLALVELDAVDDLSNSNNAAQARRRRRADAEASLEIVARYAVRALRSMN